MDKFILPLDELPLSSSSLALTVRSFAIVPIRDNQEVIALFNLGHENPEFFSETKETFFLEFLADMLSVLIPKNLKSRNEKL